MALPAGARLGCYEILSFLGAGGMGEVYRARDTRLKREVALKVLPEAFAGDPERLARFQREAELLATLNHPNIAQIYGLEQSGGTTALVLELVDGDTLADQLQQNALPVTTVLNYAQQIADALAAAHERGVIHRDLKPSNVKITPDGNVKVLDFGLARALETTTAGEPHRALSQSPTLSAMATQAGIILGTAAYMSPEQAKGLPADTRSDIFAFGIVLYEMLTRRQPFQGETVPDVLASILVRDPDIGALPANVNPRLIELVARCLQKNPKKRWQAIGDVHAELERIAAAPLQSPSLDGIRRSSPWVRRASIGAAAAIAALLGAGVATYLPRPAERLTVTRFSIPLGAGEQFTNTGRQLIAISPDGTRIVYVANQTLYLRPVSSLEATVIPGSEFKFGGVLNPVFSPDGGSIAFWTGADQSLKRIAVTGGAAVPICRADIPIGMHWSSQGILFGQAGKGIMRVAATGGQPELVAEAAPGESAGFPQLLPGGETLIFTLLTGAGNRWDQARIVAQDLNTGERTVLIDGGADGRYVPTGHIVYAIGGTLFAVPFDLRTKHVAGGPVPIVEGVRRGSSGIAQLSLSSGGALIYLPGAASGYPNQRDLGFLNRDGQIERLGLPSGPYVFPRSSVDGRYVAFGSDDGREEAIWIFDRSSRTAMRRLTFGGRNRYPLWSADGQWVAFQSDRDGDLGIFWQRADGSGTPERLTKAESGSAHVPESWSPSNDAFLYTSTKGNDVTLWRFGLRDRQTFPVAGVQSRIPISPVFSPDGKWIAYTSTDTGSAQIFVEPFPRTGAKYQISKNGGHHALWSPDGRQLLYDVTAGLSEVVGVSLHPVFSIGIPAALPRGGGFVFASEVTIRPVDMTRDGRILGAVDVAPLQPTAANQIHVVLNWFEELKQRVRAN